MADKSITDAGASKANKAADTAGKGAMMASAAGPAGAAAGGVGAVLKASEYITDPKKRKYTIWGCLSCLGCCAAPFILGLVLGIATITQLCDQYWKVKPSFFLVSPAGYVATEIAGSDTAQKIYKATYGKLPKPIQKLIPFTYYMQFVQNKEFFEKTCKKPPGIFGNLLNSLADCLTGEAALLFPENCDSAAMAKAIDTYIQKGWPNSPMNGTGAYMVEAAQRAGINPFLMAAQAQKESQFGSDPNSAPRYYNPFGTTGMGPNNQRHNRFTTYTSWEQAIDDYATNYIRRYIAVEGDKTLSDIISRYAPPSENDTNAYIKEVTGWMGQMYSLAGCTPSNKTINAGTVANCIEGIASRFAGDILGAAKSYIGKLTTYSQARRGDFSAGYCDCSSFVSKVLQDIGIDTPLYATGGMADAWDKGKHPRIKPVMLPHRVLTPSEMSQIQPGDIVIFGNAYTTNNTHVVIIQSVEGDNLYYVDCTSRGGGGVRARNRSRTYGSVWGVYRVSN